MFKKIIITGLGAFLLLATAGIGYTADNYVYIPIYKASTAKELTGRWDMTINVDGKSTPAWLEVKLSGHSTLVGRFVGASGSARPVGKIDYHNGKFSFTIPPQWETGKEDEVIQGELDGGKIRGTIKNSVGKIYSWIGVKAPHLKRTAEPEWGDPIDLFNGKNLSGWKPMGGENQWKVEDHILTNANAGANLITEQEFMDFKLHVEFRYPEGSNSGIYLRGRYEVQIEDSPEDAHPENILYGAVYGFLSPNEMATLGAGVWQTYDITLVGRMITVVANGKEVICNQEIPGITGGALDSNEDEPGPIYLQGDHGPIEFRQIMIRPAK